MRNIFIIIILISLLTSCKAFRWDPADAKKIDPRADVRARKAVQEGRAISTANIFKKGDGNFQFSSSNVLWRATLDVLDFLPLSNVDYSGGVIITDWYDEGMAGNESIKITVRFLSNEIRADGVKVIVHKKICNAKQKCNTKKIRSSLEEEIKVAILKKATLMSKSKTDKHKEEYIKKYGDHTERKSLN